MKLHSPRFEKALRKRVKQTVRSSPELKREFRRANRFRRNTRLGWLLRPCFGIVAGAVIWTVTAATGHVVTGLAIINLWLLGLLLFHSQGMWARLHTSRDMAALTLLPVSRERIFRWQMQKYFRYSLFALLDLMVCFGVLAGYCGFSPAQWVAAFLVAVLTWATLLAMAAFCVVRLPRAPFQIISSGLIVLGFVVFFGRSLVWPIVLRVLDQAAPELNLVLPTGWPVSLFQIIADHRQWWLALLLLPVAIILATIKGSLEKLFASLQYRERVFAESPDLVPGVEKQAAGKPDSGNPLRLGNTAIEEIIQSRQFLSEPLWPQRGWLEQRLWRWFGRRERVLSEFVFPNGYALTAPWLKIFRNLAVAAAAAFAAGLVSPTARFCLLGLGLFVTLCQTLAQMLSHGRAFQLIWLSGVNIPMYAGYGIGFAELSRFLLKCSLIQVPLILAFTAVAGVLTAGLAGFPVAFGIVFGLKTGCLLVASRLVFLTLAFSAGTNDTSRLGFRALALIFLMVVFGLAFMGLGGSSLFVPRQPVAWLLCLGAALDACVIFWIYQWFYNSGRFDLMSLPRR